MNILDRSQQRGKEDARGLSIGGRGGATSKRKAEPPEKINAVLSEDEQIRQRLFSLKKENQQLGADALFLGELLHTKIVEQSQVMKSLEKYILKADERNIKNIEPLKNEAEALRASLDSLKWKIESVRSDANDAIRKDLKVIYKDINQAGQKFSEGQCNQLNQSIKNFDSMLHKGRESLEFWDITKKMIVFLSVLIIATQFYLNYQFKEKLNYYNNQLYTIEQTLQGNLKYWHDVENKKLWILTQQEYEEKSR